MCFTMTIFLLLVFVDVSCPFYTCVYHKSVTTATYWASKLAIMPSIWDVCFAMMTLCIIDLLSLFLHIVTLQWHIFWRIEVDEWDMATIKTVTYKCYTANKRFDFCYSNWWRGGDTLSRDYNCYKKPFIVSISNHKLIFLFSNCQWTSC